MPEPIVHGIVGAQFGDLEFDVGKSVRWLQFYVDDLFILDINTGEQRYWVVNWTESFPEANHRVTPVNFFREPVTFRQEQFRLAQQHQSWSDNDWVLFIDAHEGLSFDNRSLPDDYSIAPFMAWTWREIERAVTAGQDYAALPFFVYLKYSDLQNVTYGTEANSNADAFGVPVVQQAISVPHYRAYGSLVRLVKVSRLKNPAFDWTTLDQPGGTPAGDPKAQVISYGYAHWNKLDVEPGQTTVEPLMESNDAGYRMRSLLSLARPLVGLSFGQPYQGLGTDPASLPGPWAVDVVANVDPGLAGTVEEDGHTAPNAAMAGIRTPLYDTVMRLNLRDGLWYERGNSGNMPLAFDDVTGSWVPRYDPSEWESMGVMASDEPEPPPSNMALSLTATSYARTNDANHLDFPNAFTLGAICSYTDWSPSGTNVMISKWGIAGQRSWFWWFSTTHMGLTWSRDGTASLSAQIPLGDLGPLVDGQGAALGVSFVTDIVSLEDEVRFFRSSDTVTWTQRGDTAVVANPSNLPIFSSTAEIQVNAHGGTTGRAASLWRIASVRSGVEPLGGFGGVEEALLRGDKTLNPSFDRYGNVWSNQGSGWTYTDTGNFPSPA